MPSIKTILLTVLLSALAGCATDTSRLKSGSHAPPEKSIQEKASSSPHSPAPEQKPAPPENLSKSPGNTLPHNTTPDSRKMPDQQKLDSALEFCQASNDFWEHGDLVNAIDALDQAYSLILEVNPDQDAEILQQREDLRFTISKRVIECYAARFTVANGYHKAIPLVMNKHVKRALDLFKGREKQNFLSAYRRSGKYRPSIVAALKEAGLPEELSWLPLIESGFKLRALSRARALGPWQFIASTGYKFGLKRDRWIDERMDPEKSTRAAIAYLKELHQIFGDWDTVLAAYNCGEGNVLKRIRTQKINYLDNFWDLYTKLPTETAFYVPKFLAVLHIMSDPEVHGFTLPPVEEAIPTECVTINKQVHLKTMSRYLEVSYDVLRELNSELRRYSTPDRAYVFKVPEGKGELLLSKLGDMPVWCPPVPTYVMHRVRKGESLSVIARRYKTNVKAIMAMNRLKKRNYVKAGWKLKIPAGKKFASLDSSSSQSANSARYVVRKGDSLWKIANRLGTTTKTIQSWNQLKSTHLRIGQILMVPKSSASFTEIKTKPYTVLAGDSPYMIAQRHQMNLSQLLRLNNLTPRSTIFPGQILTVKVE